jgi:hypothetical protein
MPDISMCPTTQCPLAKTCKRSPESGTKPDKYGQTWVFYQPTVEGDTVKCEAYWPVTGVKQ